MEDLVRMIADGKVRVPWFQRGLNWEAEHVQALFDSIYRGYPIGSLLFYRQPAKAARLKVGPLTVAAGEEANAWWVVDGQQRLTSLFVCLLRPVPLPNRPDKKDPYVLYFDVLDQKFRSPAPSGKMADSWVPLPMLLDASVLTDWAFGWRHGRDDVLRRRLFEVGARIREYSVPLYLIETEDTQAAKEIFYRTNQAGKPLRGTDVFKALFGSDDSIPSTLEDLSAELLEVGMGRLPEQRLLTSLFGLRGLDPTRTVDEHYRKDSTLLRDAAREGLPAMRKVLSFLRQEAEIPHLRLLPKAILLDVLMRFFALHPHPTTRTRTLLGRWFWRLVLGGGVFDDRTLRRRGIKAIVANDEEASVQNLLRLVDRDRVRPFELPISFDGRSDADRVVLATLAYLKPRDLETGRPLDVSELLELEGNRAFVKIFQTELEIGRGAANRMFQSSEASVEGLLRDQWSSAFRATQVSRSHALSEEALKSFGHGDIAGALEARQESLTSEVRHFTSRMAAWDHNDRPSIEYLLREPETVAQ